MEEELVAQTCGSLPQETFPATSTNSLSPTWSVAKRKRQERSIAQEIRFGAAPTRLIENRLRDNSRAV
jgi:hypothetical protein